MSDSNVACEHMEADMRYLSILLASLSLVGCGAPISNPEPRPVSVIAMSPSITNLFPTSTPVNSVPFNMTVNGSNFDTAAVVFWNGEAQRTIFITSNQLMVSLTDTDLQFAGMVPVYVRSSGLNSNTVEFNVQPQ